MSVQSSDVSVSCFCTMSSLPTFLCPAVSILASMPEYKLQSPFLCPVFITMSSLPAFLCPVSITDSVQSPCQRIPVSGFHYNVQCPCQSMDCSPHFYAQFPLQCPVSMPVYRLTVLISVSGFHYNVQCPCQCMDYSPHFYAQFPLQCPVSMPVYRLTVVISVSGLHYMRCPVSMPVNKLQSLFLCHVSIAMSSLYARV